MPTDLGAKLYDQFAPAERHTLMLEALARGDEAEAVRLKDACPRKDYTQADAGFVDRREVAFEIMLVACIDLRSMWAKLHTLQWATGEGRRLATWQQINATMAFLDGEQFGKGRPQLPWFGEDRLKQDRAEDDAGDGEGANEQELESDNG